MKVPVFFRRSGAVEVETTAGAIVRIGRIVPSGAGWKYIPEVFRAPLDVEYFRRYQMDLKLSITQEAQKL